MSEGIEVGRLRIVFRGVVQGVGFRPALYRSAVECGLAGFVQNRRSEVAAELEGPVEALERFHVLFEARLPAPARIDSRSVAQVEPRGERGFRIVESADSTYLLPPIPPDLALCDSCRRELLDPGNRRYLHPFITCTECGPRYSIVQDTPFDRERTSMADFVQCGVCRAEYENPADRRFHSQTNSCPDCGPVLRLTRSGGETVGGDPLAGAVGALARGEVLALQGIGGFHLAADPRFPGAVAKLRREKERGAKPFALMVRDEEEARRLCVAPPGALALLKSAAAPIVVLPARRPRQEHLTAVSDLDTLGIMLPYTPLHYLLFFHPGLDIPYRHLVMTSGNRGSEPIIAEAGEARSKLAGTADLFLVHDRRIVQSADDSVLRWVGTGREGQAALPGRDAAGGAGERVAAADIGAGAAGSGGGAAAAASGDG
ncbi:MAG: Sua5/YciO/YrdC/YwlC family protein, partial [Treponema sp.]|nr:Sua5/YciO/YrdC/YwlC family protein [Treponema sp.]